MMLWERFKSCNCVQLPKVGGSFRMLLWVGRGEVDFDSNIDIAQFVIRDLGSIFEGKGISPRHIISPRGTRVQFEFRRVPLISI